VTSMFNVTIILPQGIFKINMHIWNQLCDTNFQKLHYTAALLRPYLWSYGPWICQVPSQTVSHTKMPMEKVTG
jgi:hypothetical protein